MENKNDTKFWRSANWATLNGNYTPSELREIAEKIEEGFGAFQKTQKTPKAIKATKNQRG